MCLKNETFFENFFTSMGAILAIVAYELHTITMQEHQDSVNSFSRGESNTPEMNTNLIPSTCPVEQCVEVEPEKETNFEYTLPNDGHVVENSVDGLQDDLELEDYTVRLRDGVKIIIERNIKTQTPDIFVNSEVPSLTDSDLSEDENTDEKRKIYQEQILNVLKESMYDLFRK